eukprot:g28943.t1
MSVTKELPLQISFGEEIKTEYTWLQEHTRTRKRGRVQRYKFNAKQGRQVRPRLLLFSAAQSTDGDNEMGTHCSFTNGSAKAFGAFAVKLQDNGDIHHVQALFVDKDDQVVPANYPAVARTITETFFPSKFKPEELSNLSSDINRSLSAWVQDLCSKTPSMDRPLKCLRVSKAPVCQPETLKPARVRRAKGRKPGATVSQEHHDQSAFEGARASPAIQEHATAADLTKVLEKVTKNTVRDVIKEMKPLFKLGNVKKTKNAKQDDGVINKISDKLEQTQIPNQTFHVSEDENDFEKRSCNFCAVPSSYYFGPVALPPISSVPTPISSVPTHQELMHQQMQVSPTSVLGQPRSAHRVVQLSSTLQFHNFLTLSLFLFLVTAVGRFIKHHLIPLRTAMQKRKKRKRIRQPKYEGSRKAATKVAVIMCILAGYESNHQQRQIIGKKHDLHSGSGWTFRIVCSVEPHNGL